MCLVTNDLTRYVAEEDMTVYKTLTEWDDGKLTSCYYGRFEYEIGKLYEAEIEESKEKCFYDDVDIRFFEELYQVDVVQVFEKGNLMIIGSGFHSAERKYRLEHVRNYDATASVIVRCTVPKGATYHRTPTGLIVSDKIIVNEIVEKELI